MYFTFVLPFVLLIELKHSTLLLTLVTLHYYKGKFQNVEKTKNTKEKAIVLSIMLRILYKYGIQYIYFAGVAPLETFNVKS